MAKGKILLGWREWAALPELGIDRIKAKVDTGARTSTLHAFYVIPVEENGRARVQFGVHPEQNRTDKEIHCVADIVDRRIVADSGGHRTERIIIRSMAIVGDRRWPIEMTLTARDTMRFRMLLGRTAMRGHFTVDPRTSFLAGLPNSILEESAS